MLNYFLIKAGAFQHSQKAAAPEFTGTTKFEGIMWCQNGFINVKYLVIGFCVVGFRCCVFSWCNLCRFFLLKGSNNSLSRCHCLTLWNPCCRGLNQWEIGLVLARLRSLACCWLYSIGDLLVRIQFPRSVVDVFWSNSFGSSGNKNVSLGKQCGLRLSSSCITVLCLVNSLAFWSALVCPWSSAFRVSHSVITCWMVV